MQSTITRIPTSTNEYKDALQSPDITIAQDGRIIGGTHVMVWPRGRREFQGPIIESPFAACIQHCTVIDNYGGTARELQQNQLRIELGSTVVVDGFPGHWVLMRTDQRRLQGDGFRLVPVGADAAKYGHHAESADATSVA